MPTSGFSFVTAFTKHTSNSNEQAFLDEKGLDESFFISVPINSVSPCSIYL